MQLRSVIMDEAAVNRSLARITHELIERNGGAEGLVLVGVKRRGLPLAEHIAENILKFEGVSVPVGYIDITLYRDDLTEISPLPDAGDTCFPCDINDKCVVLVDDVIYTGRTARAAIEAVFALGRPKAVRLVSLVDRGHREMPIRPDYIGKSIPTSRQEKVSVVMEGPEEDCGVFIVSEAE